MSSRISHTTFDCHDAYALSAFWAKVLQFTDVPDAKQVKNRVHLDLVPNDRTRDEEIERVLALGATSVADRRRADGAGWFVLADPEGNEFCILRSDAERV